MKKIDTAEMLGITRQFLDQVLAGKRNFSFKVSRKAAVLIGGSVGLWQDGDRWEERRKVYKAFLERSKGVKE